MIRGVGLKEAAFEFIGMFRESCRIGVFIIWQHFGAVYKAVSLHKKLHLASRWQRLYDFQNIFAYDVY